MLPTAVGSFEGKRRVQNLLPLFSPPTSPRTRSFCKGSNFKAGLASMHHHITSCRALGPLRL